MRQTRTTTLSHKPELLCPAKDLEVLKTAVNFGADAVYIGGEAYGLRAKARNFSHEDMAEGIRYAHAHGVHVHVTANILAHDADLEGAADYFHELEELRPDAVLVADPGMFLLAKENCPDVDIHISTQANNTNYETFRFWAAQGAKRVVCARELSLAEIREIRDKVPEDLEIEAFVHGAMCISYSGRCLLSNYFTGRDANHGECTHPCRWKYAVMEESRPGEYLPIEENERGTFIFNSKDLCMIEHIPELVEAGLDSFKIEGRMKTALYVATVARTYRKAIDDYFESEEKYRANLPWYQEEIRKCTYRRFTTGFYFGKPSAESMVYDSNTYISEAVWLGIVEDVRQLSDKNVKIPGIETSFPDKDGKAPGIQPSLSDKDGKAPGIQPSLLDKDGKAPGMRISSSDEVGRMPNALTSKSGSKKIFVERSSVSPVQADTSAGAPCAVRIMQRNKFCVGDTIEIMKPDGRDIPTKVLAMYNDKGEPVSSAPHPQEMLWVVLDRSAQPQDLLRTCMRRDTQHGMT